MCSGIGDEFNFFKTAMDMIESSAINVRNMITHKMPLSDIQRGFKLVSEAKE
jgi:threonine dehydrogenase-like Zn-dependent dehydrogenase